MFFFFDFIMAVMAPLQYCDDITSTSEVVYQEIIPFITLSWAIAVQAVHTMFYGELNQRFRSLDEHVAGLQ